MSKPPTYLRLRKRKNFQTAAAGGILALEFARSLPRFYIDRRELPIGGGWLIGKRRAGELIGKRAGRMEVKVKKLSRAHNWRRRRSRRRIPLPFRFLGSFVVAARRED